MIQTNSIESVQDDNFQNKIVLSPKKLNIVLFETYFTVCPSRASFGTKKGVCILICLINGDFSTST